MTQTTIKAAGRSVAKDSNWGQKATKRGKRQRINRGREEE
jgi:hypothetical protein